LQFEHAPPNFRLTHEEDNFFRRPFPEQPKSPANIRVETVAFEGPGPVKKSRALQNMGEVNTGTSAKDEAVAGQ
jgi:hypothetical protein